MPLWLDRIPYENCRCARIFLDTDTWCWCYQSCWRGIHKFRSRSFHWWLTGSEIHWRAWWIFHIHWLLSRPKTLLNKIKEYIYEAMWIFYVRRWLFKNAGMIVWGGGGYCALHFFQGISLWSWSGWVGGGVQRPFRVGWGVRKTIL